MAKMQVSGQNRLRLMASTIWPRARSLSATWASGVGQSGLVPLVWSLGRQMMLRLGKSPRCSNCFSSPMNCAARNTSGMSRSQPTVLVARYGRSDSMAGRLRISISPVWLSEVAVVIEEPRGALLRGDPSTAPR